MGAGNSKPAADSQYVFAADSPVSFSSQVVNSLQNSPETDSVRARTLDLHVQQRVTAELEKLRAAESTRLDDLTASLTPTDPATSSSSSDSSSDPSTSSSLKDKLTSALPFGNTPNNDRSHDSVSKEVAELKAKLERRARKEAVDKEVETAKEKLVQCLRVKDRRPLDCWEEVEGFKREVARLEARFVDKALR